VNSYTGAVQIAPANVPVLPSIDESAEEILERVFEAYGAIQAGLLSKQDVYDEDLQTNEKTVIGAINELNTKEMQNSGDIVELRTDVDELKLDVNEIKLDTQNQAQEIDNLKDEVDNIKTNYATNEYVNNLYTQLSLGGNKSLVFDTKQQFLNWLAGIYERPDGYLPGALKLGDVILLKEQGVPDYWVSSISSPMTINNFTEYEVKIAIEDYATLEQVNALADRVEVVEENLTQIIPDVARALKTPISTPATTKLVAVDNTNSQEMITIGDNLTLENGTLKATGGGGSAITVIRLPKGA
jgi:outer membrane murein-binding lipoprotein Lpp